MSVRSWQEEFYPVHAEAAAGSDLEAARHSLRKWEGLTAESLAKHGVDVDKDDGIFPIADNCALCCFSDCCEECPLHITTGEICSRSPSAYQEWRWTRNAAPMIAALRQTVAAMEVAQEKHSQRVRKQNKRSEGI